MWRAVVGYEGRYEVSDAGEVRSLPCRVPTKGGVLQARPGRVLKPSLSGGYPSVDLLGSTLRVHRLVLLAFVGPPPPGAVCLHADDDRSNARLTNLSWGTPAKNSADMVARGRAATGIRNGKHTKPGRTPRGRTHGMATLLPTDLERAADLLRDGCTQKAAAKWLGISPTHMNRIAHDQVGA